MNIVSLASSSRGNCYVIDDGSTRLLLDCGISIKEIKRGLGFRLSEVTACLLSHFHGDHAKSVKELMRLGVDIYMSEPTKDALGVTGHRIREIKAREQFKISTWTILPFETQHDCPGSLGFLLASRQGEKLLYITDSYYCKYKFTGLHYIMIEVNHSYDILERNVESGSLPVAMKNRLIQSHFSLENVKEFLKANDLSKVKEIWLLHLSDGNSDAELFKREIQELTGKMVFVA